MLQTDWKFIKYVIHNKHSMTPSQLKKKPIEPIVKIEHEKLDTEEGESNKEEEESTTSTLSEENLHLIHLLNLHRIQIQLKHLNIQLFISHPNMMILIHLKTNQ